MRDGSPSHGCCVGLRCRRGVPVSAYGRSRPGRIVCNRFVHTGGTSEKLGDWTPAEVAETWRRLQPLQTDAT